MKALLIIFSIVLFTYGASAQDTAYVAGRNETVRGRPAAKGRAAGTVKKGDSLSILEKKGDWYRVTAGKTTGWLPASSVVRLTANSSDAAKPSDTIVDWVKAAQGTYYSPSSLRPSGDSVQVKTKTPRDGGVYDVSLVEYDCKQSKYRILRRLTYRDGGILTASDDYQSLGVTNWAGVAPGSPAELLQQQICTR
jgi:Bacterial SH3 domain